MSFTTTLRSTITSTFASGQGIGAINAARVGAVETAIANLLDILAAEAASVLTPSADTSGVADTNALTAAIAVGGIINMTAGDFYISLANISIASKAGVVIRGAGRKTTIIHLVGTGGDGITFLGADNCGIERVTFLGDSINPPSSGFAIKFSGNCFQCWARDIICQYVYGAVNIHNSTECRIDAFAMRPIAGPDGILFDGTTDTRSFRAVITDVMADNYYQRALNALRGAWTSSTSYALGDVVKTATNIYQCVGAGTSGGSGPTGTSFASNVTDGSAAWRFVTNANHTWIRQDSYAYSLVIDKGALIDGVVSVAMTDSGGGGIASSAPQWLDCFDLECDHPYTTGVSLAGGAGFYLVDGWLGSSLTGSGLNAASGFAGEVEVATTRIVGNAQHGVIISCPKLFGGFSRCLASTNSVSSQGTFSGFSIAAGVSNFSIQNCYSGVTNGGSGYQKYGVLVNTGSSDHYQVSGNNCPGNATAAVLDGGSGTNKSVTGNNA